MFSRYYQSELAHLRETGREFAKANPSLADAFAERGGDPDVERLLEGCAFLTARIRERAEDAVPELVDSLGQLLLPHYQRPLPASTIVELEPRAPLRNRHRIPQGTPLGSEAVDGTRCIFRTTEELELVPVHVGGAELDSRHARHPQIRVRFRVPEQSRHAVFHPNGLRLFLHGSWSLSSTLVLWLERHLSEARVQSGRDLDIRLPDGAVQPHCGREAAGLWPWPELAPDAPRRLQEHFASPEAHAFFDVFGLERVPPDGVLGSFELLLRFESPPSLPGVLPHDAVRAHCVPAINLFHTSSEPIDRDPLRREFLIRAAGLARNHAEVFAVESVTGLRARREGRIDYRPLYAPHFADKDGDPPDRYTIRRAPSPVDDASDAYVSVRCGDEGGTKHARETLSLDLICTHRMLPASLHVGDISCALPGSPSVATFRNITGVTKPVSPPVGTETQWKLLRHLALSHRSLGDARSLRAVLDLYNFHRGVDVRAARSNEQRIESIRSVEMRPSTRVFRGAPVQGIHTTVEVDDDCFASPGDAFLFGSALDLLFAGQLPLNTFHRLTLRLHPSLGELRWTARTGTKEVL